MVGINEQLWVHREELCVSRDTFPPSKAPGWWISGPSTCGPQIRASGQQLRRIDGGPGSREIMTLIIPPIPGPALAAHGILKSQMDKKEISPHQGQNPKR